MEELVHLFDIHAVFPPSRDERCFESRRILKQPLECSHQTELTRGFGWKIVPEGKLNWRKRAPSARLDASNCLSVLLPHLASPLSPLPSTFTVDRKKAPYHPTPALDQLSPPLPHPSFHNSPSNEMRRPFREVGVLSAVRFSTNETNDGEEKMVSSRLRRGEEKERDRARNERENEERVAGNSRRQSRRSDILLAVDKDGSLGVGFGYCHGRNGEGGRERVSEKERKTRRESVRTSEGKENSPISVPSLCSSVSE